MTHVEPASEQLAAAQGPPTTWDGTERRAATPAADVGQKVMEAIHAVQPSPATNQQAFVGMVVAAGAILALQVLILTSQFRLADRQDRAEANQKLFRDSIVCFVVESVNNPQPVAPQTGAGNGTGILTKCGFITVPGNR